MARHLTEAGVAARQKSDRAVGIARRLRKQMTPAEKALWFELRRLAFDGSHFRKQSPLGPFIVDFVCHRAALAIELDGGAHDAPDVAERDRERQTWIEGRGYCVLRFKNSDVLRDARVIAQEINAVVERRIGVRS